MASSNFQLTWDSYQKKICDGFSHLQQSQEFVDMTLAAEGHLVKVHKNLIALASPYLKEMINSVPCQHPVIFLNHVSHRTLSYILEYVYSGEVLVPMLLMDDFLKAAKALHIIGVRDLSSPKVNVCNNNLLKNFAPHFKKTPSEDRIPKEDEFPLEDKTIKVEVNRIPEVDVHPEENILPEVDIHREENILTEATVLNNNQQNVDFPASMTSSNEDQQTSTDHLTNNGVQNLVAKNRKLIASSVTNIVIKRTGDNSFELVQTSNKRKKSTQNAHQNNNFEDSIGVHVINLPDTVSNCNEQEYLTSATNSDVQYIDCGINNINNQVTDDTFDNVVKDLALEDTISGQFNEDDNWNANEDINMEQNDYLHEEPVMNLNRGFSDVRSALQIGDTNTNYAEPQSNNNYKINVELPSGSRETPKITINGSSIETKPVFLKEATAKVDILPELKTDISVPTPLYSVSNKGKLQLILNRFIYNNHHTTKNGKRRWRCIEYRQQRCPAFVDTEGEMLISRKLRHNHPFHDARILEIGQRKHFFSSIKAVEEITNEPDYLASYLMALGDVTAVSVLMSNAEQTAQNIEMVQ